MEVVKAEKKPCSHCENYVADTTGLCGNCRLIPEPQLKAQKEMRQRMAEGRKKADAAAKQAYIDEMRRLNAEEARAVTGSDASPSDKAEARSAALSGGK